MICCSNAPAPDMLLNEDTVLDKCARGCSCVPQRLESVWARCSSANTLRDHLSHVCATTLTTCSLTRPVAVATYTLLWQRGARVCLSNTPQDFSSDPGAVDRDSVSTLISVIRELPLKPSAHWPQIIDCPLWLSTSPKGSNRVLQVDLLFPTL